MLTTAVAEIDYDVGRIVIYICRIRMKRDALTGCDGFARLPGHETKSDMNDSGLGLQSQNEIECRTNLM
jgi:hypothetical protein